MLSSESPVAVVAQCAVLIALIAAATVLAYVDLSSRQLLEGALVVGIGTATGYFFSQRSATNGMSTMAGLIATATPGPPGPVAPRGAPGPFQETQP